MEAGEHLTPGGRPVAAQEVGGIVVVSQGPWDEHDQQSWDRKRAERALLVSEATWTTSQWWLRGHTG